LKILFLNYKIREEREDYDFIENIENGSIEKDMIDLVPFVIIGYLFVKDLF
jgi:hypothetical protein